MKVAELWIYPIKGIGGQKLENAFATESGFLNDRRFMLIDENNKFISQRSHPTLACLEASILDEKLIVQDKVDSNKIINIDPEILQNHVIDASVWKSKVESQTFQNEVNQWFSNYLNDNVRLVKQKSFACRTRSLPFKPNKIGLSYADGYPYLVLSKASVADLAERMQEPVDLRQFRANIIVDDCQAYEEDLLKSFSIHEAGFKMVKPCKRCPVININQDTGESHQNVVKAVSKYRRQENSIIFGMNAANVKEGIVKVNEELKF